MASDSLFIAEAVTAPTDAGAIAFLASVGATTILFMTVLWFILQVIADWKIFQKAGEAGWKSIIPILNVITEYGLSWNAFMGVIYMVCSIASYILSNNQTEMSPRMIIAGIAAFIVLVLHIIQSLKLSRAFGHRIGFAVLLILLGPIGRIILGFGDSRYIGPQ